MIDTMISSSALILAIVLLRLILKTICVINKHSFSIREINKTAHLLFEALYVMVDCLFCHHLTHICTSGWVTNHGSTTTD